MSRVGLFFYVNENLLLDFVEIDKAIEYGDCLIGATSHYDIWENQYFYKLHRSYDYYPRGRVVYNKKENLYIIYADKCIDEKGIMLILLAFEIENENVRIDRTDEHYVCSKCNKEYCG